MKLRRAAFQFWQPVQWPLDRDCGPSALPLGAPGQHALLLRGDNALGGGRGGTGAVRHEGQELGREEGGSQQELGHLRRGYDVSSASSEGCRVHVVSLDLAFIAWRLKLLQFFWVFYYFGFPLFSSFSGTVFSRSDARRWNLRHPLFSSGWQVLTAGEEESSVSEAEEVTEEAAQTAAVERGVGVGHSAAPSGRPHEMVESFVEFGRFGKIPPSRRRPRPRRLRTRTKTNTSSQGSLNSMEYHEDF